MIALQVKYVVELARALAQHPAVYRVDLLTRLIDSPQVDASYSEPEECILPSEGQLGGAYIVRLPCGPQDSYLRYPCSHIMTTTASPKCLFTDLLAVPRLLRLMQKAACTCMQRLSGGPDVFKQPRQNADFRRAGGSLGNQIAIFWSAYKDHSSCCSYFKCIVISPLGSEVFPSDLLPASCLYFTTQPKCT